MPDPKQTCTSITPDEARFLLNLRGIALNVFEVAWGDFLRSPRGNVAHLPTYIRAAQCRWAFAYLARILTPIAYEDLAGFCGRKSHVPILYWVCFVAKLPASDPIFAYMHRILELVRENIEIPDTIPPHALNPESCGGTDRHP